MTKNRNITIFISSLTGGGAERVSCNLANYLSNKDYNVTLITMSDVKDTYILSDKVKRIYLLHQNERKNKIHDFLLRYKRLKEIVKNDKDCFCYIVMLPKTTAILMSLKKYTKAKIIISDRVNPENYGLIDKFLMKKSAKKADTLVVQTDAIAKYYQGISKNIVIIPNAVNYDILKIKRASKIDNKIVSVGRLTPQKNYPMLIKAFANFYKNHKEYVLEIYGDGPLKNDLINLTKELNITKVVKFIGYQDNVLSLINNAKMFVLTSNYEGMPNALIEAMTIGIPCIATDCDGGGSKYLLSNNNGILINKDSIDELVSAMERIISDDKQVNIMLNNSNAFIKTLYPENIYASWESTIVKAKHNN